MQRAPSPQHDEETAVRAGADSEVNCPILDTSDTKRFASIHYFARRYSIEFVFDFLRGFLDAIAKRFN